MQCMGAEPVFSVNVLFVWGFLLFLTLSRGGASSCQLCLAAEGPHAPGSKERLV